MADLGYDPSSYNQFAKLRRIQKCIIYRTWCMFLVILGSTVGRPVTLHQTWWHGAVSKTAWAARELWMCWLPCWTSKSTYSTKSCRTLFKLIRNLEHVISLFSHWVAAANATCLRNFNWDDKIVGMMKEVTHVHATFRAQGAELVLTCQLFIS